MSTFYLQTAFSTPWRVVNWVGKVPGPEHFTKLSKDAAAQMADQLINLAFPMKVIKVDGRQLWINRGQDGGLASGDKLAVYRPSGELIDPDTGERLGPAEVEVAKAVVKLVNPKHSVAEIPEDAKDRLVLEGDILRLRK